jgi:SWIB/MDM2 domain
MLCRSPYSRRGARRGGRLEPVEPGGEQDLWEYIRSHNLQNPENRREILADDKLRKVFGKDKVTMFEMNKHLAGHLK